MDENEHDIQNPPPSFEESVPDGSNPLAESETPLSRGEVLADDAPELNDAEQAIESASESVEEIQSVTEEQGEDTLRDIQSMLNRHQEMMESRLEAMGRDRETITENRQEHRQSFEELIGRIHSALSHPIEDASTGPAPEIHESSLTPEARMRKSREDTITASSNDSELEEMPDDSMSADAEKKLPEDPTHENDAASALHSMEMELPSTPLDPAGSTEVEREPVEEHSDEDIERIVAQTLGESGAESEETDQPTAAAESTSVDTNNESVSDENFDEELSRILSEALDADSPPNVSVAPDVATPEAFEASEDIDQDLNDLLGSVLASTAVQSQSNFKCTGPGTTDAIMPLLDEDDPDIQEITADLQHLLELAFSEEAPADDHATPSPVDTDTGDGEEANAQALPAKMSAEEAESSESTEAPMPIEAVEAEATEERLEDTPQTETAPAFPDEATVSTVCDQIFSQLDAELNDSVASMMDTDMEAIEAVLDSIFDEQSMFVEDEEDSAVPSNEMACDDTGGAVRPMPESLKSLADSETKGPVDDSGEASPIPRDSTDELAGPLDDAVSAVNSEIERELVKTSDSHVPEPESAPVVPVESSSPFGELWKKAEPPLVTVLSMVNWPLRKIPEKARSLVDWFALSLVFWVPVVWVVVMFAAGR